MKLQKTKDKYKALMKKAMEKQYRKDDYSGRDRFLRSYMNTESIAKFLILKELQHEVYEEKINEKNSASI